MVAAVFHAIDNACPADKPNALLVFKGANPAAIWTIFICSIWPMIINTAVGVQRVP